jgi:opacity protein-like surface antigen
MRKLMLATTVAAVALVASPAAAQRSGGYIGVEGGILFPQDQDLDAAVNFNDPAIADLASDNIADLDFKRGYDVDLIGGYDFGMFRLEGELGYKRAKLDNIDFDAATLTAINTASGNTLTSEDFGVRGKASVLSAMLNGLVDFDAGGFGAYVGAGIGRARVRELGDADNAWAYQLIAGVKTAVSENIDVGLKYRYFRTGNLDFNRDFAFVGATGFSGGTTAFDVSDRFSSHSLLLSLVYNFASAAPPPPPPVEVAPPPPAAPATQTCPDGSVILATSACPLPPAPPPPPPVERGERGR